MKSKLTLALSRAKFAAIGAAIGGAAGGLFNKNMASTGAAAGALLGAIVGEKRVSVRAFVNDVKERREELPALSRS